MSNDGMSYDDSLSAFGHADDDAHQAIDDYYNGLINNILYSGAHAAVAALQNGGDGSGAWTDGGLNNAAMSTFVGGQGGPFQNLGWSGGTSPALPTALDTGPDMPANSGVQFGSSANLSGLALNQTSGSLPNILGVDLTSLMPAPNRPALPTYNFADANAAGGSTPSANPGMVDPSYLSPGNLPTSSSGLAQSLNSPSWVQDQLYRPAPGFDLNSPAPNSGYQAARFNAGGDPVTPMNDPNTTVSNGYDPTKFDILSDNGSGSTWPGVNTNIGSGSQSFQIDPQDPYGIGAAAIGLNNGDGNPSFNFDPQNPYGAQLDLSKGEGIQPLGINNPGYIPQDGDRELLARIIFSEGAGVSDDYPALAWAIVNRVGARGFPSTLREVIKQTDSKGRPELGINTPLWSSSALPDSLTGLDALSYQKALSVADGVLNGSIADPTQGARYFYSGNLPSKGFFPNAISSGRLVPAPPGTAFKFYRDTQN